MTNKFKTIRLIVVLSALIWFVGAAIMIAVYEYERRSECDQYERLLKNLPWCEAYTYPREEFSYSYMELAIKGLRWPLHLISSENNDPILSLSDAIYLSRKEEMPPVGENQALNYPQVRWCVFEKARLEVMEGRTMTDQEVSELKEETEIKKYIARAGALKKYVARHNKRCTKFRSQQGTLEFIERELLFEGKRLQSEGAQL
ncbi:MAG: hypothetical protein E4H07_07875 [Nitrosomonadales bacterium]|nr:MAG: hypothetical protein E4H07_07875 [Nitrosomonadales bacterium]